MKYILSKKFKICTKEILKFFNYTLLGTSIIMSFVIFKYKPVYEVNIDGKKIGYVENKKRFGESVNKNINEYKAKNINDVK